MVLYAPIFHSTKRFENVEDDPGGVATRYSSGWHEIDEARCSPVCSPEKWMQNLFMYNIFIVCIISVARVGTRCRAHLCFFASLVL